MNKFPAEIQIIISRELTGETWLMKEVMSIVSCEVSAQERSGVGVPPFTMLRGRVMDFSYTGTHRQMKLH